MKTNSFVQNSKLLFQTRPQNKSTAAELAYYLISSGIQLLWHMLPFIYLTQHV